VGFIRQVQRTNRRFSAPSHHASVRHVATQVLRSRPVQRTVRHYSAPHLARGVFRSHGVQHAARGSTRQIRARSQRSSRRTATGPTNQAIVNAVRTLSTPRIFKQLSTSPTGKRYLKSPAALHDVARTTLRIASASALPESSKVSGGTGATVFNTRIGPTGIAKRAANYLPPPAKSAEQAVRAARLREQAGTSLPKPRLSTPPPAYGRSHKGPHPFKAGKGISTAINTVGRALIHGDPTQKYTPTLAQAVRHGGQIYVHSAKKHPIVSISGGTPAVVPGPRGVKVYGPDKKTVQLTQNIINDAINLPAGVPQTAFGVAKVGVSAAHGDTKPAKALWKGLKNHTFIGNALQGRWKQAGRQAFNHPLDTGLELSGAKAVIGRGAGAGLRGVGKVTGSKALKRAGSTKRAPLKLYAHSTHGPTHPRTYSKDAINKAVQVLADRRRAKKHGKDTVKPGSRHQKHLLSQKLNADIAMHESVRRIRVGRGTAQVVHQTRAGKVGKVRAKLPKTAAARHRTPGVTAAHQQAIPLAVERVLTTPKNVVRDLKRYRQKLVDNPPPNPSHADLALHQQMVKQVDGLLADKKFLANPHPAFHAAEKVIAGEHPLTQRLQNLHLLSQDEAAAAHVPYAIVHMRAKPSKAGLPTVRMTAAEQAAAVSAAQAEHAGHMADAARLAQAGTTRGVQAALNRAKAAQARAEALRASPDRHLTVDEIKAHMQDPANHGGDVVPAPGFFSQRPGATGKGSFYTAAVGRNMKRVQPYFKHRSGAAVLHGTHEADIPALVAQRARAENLVSQAEGHQALFGKYGLHKSVDAQGRPTYFGTRDEANTAATELSPHVGVDLVPVNLGNAKAIQDLYDTGQIEHLTHAGLSGRVHAMFSDTGHGQYVLVPKMLQEKLTASVAPRGGARRRLEEFTKHWKASVLTTSTHWPAGNAIDLATRLGMEGIGPSNVLRGIRLMAKTKKVSPAAADELNARAVGAFMRSQRGMETFRPPNRVARLPVVKQIAGAWRGYRDTVYGANGVMENLASYGALGKWAGRQVDGFMRHSSRGLDELARGMVHTHNQEAAAAFVERVVGRWGKYSPQMRAVLIHAPFVQWLGVALKYVYVTLPAHHPIKTAIAAALDEMSVDERKKLGLYVDPFHNDPGQLAPNQQAGVRAGPTSNVFPSGTFSSFGTGAQFAANPLGTLGNFAAAPQLSTAINMGRYGLDAFGNPIRNPDGSKPTQMDLNLLAAYSIVEPLVPFASASRRVMERGGSSSPTSTIFSPRTTKAHPGKDVLAGLTRTFNPFRTQIPFTPNQPYRKKGRKSAGSSGGGAGGPGGFGGGSSGGGPGGFGKTQSLEAQHIPGIGFVMPQALGGLLAKEGARQAGPRKVTTRQAAPILAQSVKRAPRQQATVFNTRMTPADLLMQQGVAKAGGKALRSAQKLPDVKRWNVDEIRRALRENPQYRKNALGTIRLVRGTKAIPPWARQVPLPRVVFAKAGVVTDPRSSLFGKMVPSPNYPGAAWAPRGRNTIVVSPVGVHGAFSGGARNAYRQIPVHEYAHTLQRQNLGHRLEEGGAEAFRVLAASDAGLRPSGWAPGYGGFARRAQSRGQRFVTRGQFNPAIGKVAVARRQFAARQRSARPSKVPQGVTYKARLFAHPQRPQAKRHGGRAQLNAGNVVAREALASLGLGNSPAVDHFVQGAPTAFARKGLGKIVHGMRKAGFSEPQILHQLHGGVAAFKPGQLKHLKPAGRGKHSAIDKAILAGAKGITKGVQRGGVSAKAVRAVSGDPKVAATIVRVGHQVHATPKELLAAIETGIEESHLQNLAGGSGSSVGWRQETAQPQYGSQARRMNVATGARDFFKETAQKGHGKGMTAGQLAQAVQRRASGQSYDGSQAAALAILRGSNKKLTKAQQRAFKIIDKGRPRRMRNAVPIPNATGVPSSTPVSTSTGVPSSKAQKLAKVASALSGSSFQGTSTSTTTGGLDPQIMQLILRYLTANPKALDRLSASDPLQLANASKADSARLLYALSGGVV
jgi:hypothetical protein